MLTNPPPWLSMLETISFLLIIAGFVYSRLVNWRSYNDRTSKLEAQFDQYQKDMGLFLETYKTSVETFLQEYRKDLTLFIKTCETCRSEVRGHHESDTKHVTVDLREKIDQMAESINEIKNFLMTKP